MHAQVLIILDDANVHKPNFTSETYAGQVAENAEPGTLVLVVQATDSDQVCFVYLVMSHFKLLTVLYICISCCLVITVAIVF